MSGAMRRIEDLDALVDEMMSDGSITRRQVEAYGVVRGLLLRVLEVGSENGPPEPVSLVSYFEEAHREAATALMD